MHGYSLVSYNAAMEYCGAACGSHMLERSLLETSSRLLYLALRPLVPSLSHFVGLVHNPVLGTIHDVPFAFLEQRGKIL
jgi:hypothetical protein